MRFKPQKFRAIGILSIVLACIMLATPTQAARLALVIGNAAYVDGPLRNPVNDARAVDKKLTTLGFQVQRVENLKRLQIGRTLTAFANNIKAGDEVLVFYAGHGVQLKGVNYLPAVDADIQSEVDVPLNSLNLNDLMERLDDAKAGLKLFFLDACRNNPYARNFRSGDRGLARVGAAPAGTLIHFATRPGSVAADGAGSNGLYTTELLRYIDSPDTPVESMLKRVSAAVEAQSKGQQEPWTEGSIRGEFYFKPGTTTQVASIRPELEPGPSVFQAEQQAWNVAQRTNSVAAYSAFLVEFPQSSFAAAARVALADLKTETMRPVSRADVTTAQSIRDCAECPEMVVIPAGSFEMGSENGNWERPLHRVSVNIFAIGKFEVTQGQWTTVMGSNPSKFSNCGDDCPVENVSWNDVQEFIRKLNQKTGAQYRLPSEAEWEYAARAGSTGKYFWGDKIGMNNANCYGCGSKWDNQTIAPVGQFLPNSFGLHDMHGNVWEWVQDYWHYGYVGAPTDGGAWESNETKEGRVRRGGGWDRSPTYLTSSVRGWDRPDLRYYFTGFRLARTTP